MIRDAIQDDVASIVAISRAGFPEELLRFTIMGSEGYDLYIGDRIMEGDSRRARFRVDSSGSWVRGFAEWRVEGSTAHLNNIFVATSERGVGIGTGLLSDLFNWVDPAVCSVTAHAFVDNDRVNRWYRSVGMAETGRRYWTMLEMGADLSTGIHAVVHRPQTESDSAPQTRYGFDSVPIELEGERFQIGRLPGGISRYVAESPDARVVEWLRQGICSPRALVISGSPEVPGVLLGMQIEYECALERLAESLGVGSQ